MEQSLSWKANRFSASQEIPPNFVESECSLPHSQQPATRPCSEPPSPGQLYPIRNTDSLYGEKLLAPRPTPELEDHP
jgi:hypothetical protein